MCQNSESKGGEVDILDFLFAACLCVLLVCINGNFNP